MRTLALPLVLAWAPAAGAQFRRCVREAPDSPCWTCRDFEIDRTGTLCGSEGPCADTTVCLRRTPDRVECWPGARVCCADATCDVPPGCDGASSCVGPRCDLLGVCDVPPDVEPDPPR